MSAVRDFYARLGITLMRAVGNEAPARCFASPDAHRREDRHPSVSVNLDRGVWLCHGCGARGGAYDAALLRGHTPRSAMDLLVTHGLAEPRRALPPRQAPWPVREPASTTGLSDAPVRAAASEQDVADWAIALTRRTTLTARLATERAITAEVLARFQIGYDGRRVTIPVRSAAGELAGILRWLPFDRRGAPKMLALAGSRRVLCPAPEHLPPGPVVLCEGEPDALAAHGVGLTAVAIPGVAGWKDEWAPRFTGRLVTIVMDCDDDGRACAQRIALDLADAGVSAVVVDLASDRADGYDLTDHLLGGGSIDALRR